MPVPARTALTTAARWSPVSAVDPGQYLVIRRGIQTADPTPSTTKTIAALSSIPDSSHARAPKKRPTLNPTISPRLMGPRRHTIAGTVTMKSVCRTREWMSGKSVRVAPLALAHNPHHRRRRLPGAAVASI
jgi:hypothetical protein